MEQLAWAIIMIIFAIFIALKNRARNRQVSNINRTADTEPKTREEDDSVGRYMEELLGIERSETKPQTRTKRETPKPLKERITPREESKATKKVGQFESPLVKELSEKRTSPLPEKKEIYHAKFPWSTLSKKDLPGAIVLAEIIGPPISKRKSHRLF